MAEPAILKRRSLADLLPIIGIPAPDTQPLREVRCPDCRKLLCKMRGELLNLQEIACPRCGNLLRLAPTVR